ncbi:MAG: hypothetical protein OSA47_11750 [Novosphingopyxis baekryungensis]|nr:hypothetical protein [Novosphingopyxis baekryungensis]
MTSILTLLLAGAVIALITAAVWQHFRYLRVRRERLEDRQPLLYGGAAFHTVTFLKVEAAEGREGELATLRALRGAIESAGGGRVIYAGLVGVTMAKSEQLANDWSAVLLTQYPSKDAFERRHESAEVGQVLGGCERSYVHGFRRPALLNGMLPIGLGVMRLLDIALRREPALPFQPLAAEDALLPIQLKRKEILQLDDYRDIRDDAVVVVNLIQPGTAEQRAADRSYTREMMRAMAEGGYGPVHMGRAIQVEGGHRFEQFVAVYYPGIDHMHAMIGSAFMNRIGPGKQLGDTLAVATIPVLSKLGGAEQ